MSTKTLIRSGEFIPAIMNDFFRPWNEWVETGSGFWGKTLSVPAVNISENPDHFKVSLAAPGLRREDFQIELEGNMLTIHSETKEEKTEKAEKYSKKEYSYSSFSRSFTLPDGVNKEKIAASYENGILQLVLPKSDGAKKISVEHIAVK